MALVVMGAGAAVGIRLMGASTPTPTAGTSPQPTPSAADTPTPTPTPVPSASVTAGPTVAVAQEGWQVHPDAPFGVGGVVAWTGEELVVGAGTCCAAMTPPELAGYDPATEAWRALPDHPVRCRAFDEEVWTGDELIFLGGCTAHDCVMTGSEDPWEPIDGYALDVDVGTWRTLASAPRSLPIVDHALWTGSEILGLGRGRTDATEPVLLLRYDPATDSWAEGPVLPGPARRDFAAVWTGEHLLVWGGTYQLRPWPEDDWEQLADGWAYTPDTDTWTPITPAPMPGATRSYATWTGTEMIIWGGAYGRDVGETSTRGAAYDPVTDSWRTLADLSAGALPDRLSSPEPWASVWTGTEFIVWIPGIADWDSDLGASPDDWATVGAAYTPTTDTWRILPPTPMSGIYGTEWTGGSVLLTGSLIDDVQGGPPGQRIVEYHPGPTHSRG